MSHCDYYMYLCKYINIKTFKNLNLELIIPIFSVKWNYVFQNNKYAKK